MIPLRYTDPKYGFALRIPNWWRPYLVVQRIGRSGEMAYGVQFLFKYKGKIYTDIITFSVYRMTPKQWRDKGYDESPLVLVAARNGRIFAYSTPGELPPEFLDSSGNDYDYQKYGRPIRLLKRMVNKDAPELVKTFRFANVPSYKKTQPLRPANSLRPDE